MKGIFINDDYLPYTNFILMKLKSYETRNRNMLGKLLGERVALISTSKNHKPRIVGFATISEARHVNPEEFEMFRTSCIIVEGSKYDCGAKGKWLYRMKDPERCEPRPLPEDIIRHGRSWCDIPQYVRITEV